MGGSSNDDQTWSAPHWKISASTDIPAEPPMGDLVMAWARDRTTEDPRYIGELGEHQRGANCNCECISCGLPLVAVNAAKTTFKIRPHFRHPEGAEKSSCLILAARAAALATLKSTGILELPRRRQSARVAGLSGEYYDAWVETPPEQVRVHDFKFHDRVSGILTLEDGRQLKVELIGSVGPDTSSETGALIPTILMSVEDPHIAGMPPEELIKRLRLIVDNASWCSHWNDEALALEADEAAREMAVDALDWLGDDVSFPDAVDGDVKRETLLHLKAKEILEREKRIFLPDLSIEVEAKLLNGELLYKQDVVPGQMVQLESVILEKNLGRIKPDVMANTIEAPAWPAGTILIEVTVTNTISEERIERIKAVNIPTIEIDISKMGGRVTEAEFERLVIEELAGKRWLHHPRMAQEEIRLRRELTIEVNIANTIELGRLDLERKHKEIKSVSVDKWAHQYLHSVQSHAEARVQVEVSGGDPQGREDALERIYECAAGLSAYGFQEAQDKALFWQRGNILERILSLKQNKAIGYKLDTAWQVINSILQERPPHSKWQTLYLIATKVYKPTLNTQQAERVADWRNEVWRSLGHGEQTYQRSREYDNLLALLFPELAEALAQSLTRKMYSANRQPSIASATQNRLAGQNGYVQFGYRNSRVSISVSDCDEWMKKNPEWEKIGEDGRQPDAD